MLTLLSCMLLSISGALSRLSGLSGRQVSSERVQTSGKIKAVSEKVTFVTFLCALKSTSEAKRCF